MLQNNNNKNGVLHFRELKDKTGDTGTCYLK